MNEHDIRSFVKILEDKQQENEALKIKADLYDQLKFREIEFSKLALGNIWNDGYEILSIPALKKLTKDFGRRG